MKPMLLKAAASVAALVIAAAPLFAAGKFHPVQADAPFAHYLVTVADGVPDAEIASLAAELAKAHGGRLELYAAAGFRGFAVVMPASQARLLSEDPRVTSVDEQSDGTPPPSAPALTQAALTSSSPVPVSPFKRPLALQSDKLASTSTSTEPWSGTYRYDAAGRIAGIGDNTYTYDGAGRLTQATAITTAQSDTRTYAYDVFGNLLTQTTSAGVDASGVNWQTNRMDQAGTCPAGSNCVVAAYDVAGNQVSGGGATYVVDAVNMITELQAAGRHDVYIYDADDQRIATVNYADGQNQTWRYTVRDLQKKVARQVDDTIVSGQHAYAWRKDYIYRDAALLAAASPNGESEVRVHFHLDHLGSPRLTTDALGVKLAMHTYWPFGREASGGDTDVEPMKYTGHERDFAGPANVNDLDYMHARYYTSIAARFLSVDPKLNSSAAATEPQKWNRYTYVVNDPLRFTDPTGQEIYFQTHTIVVISGGEMEPPVTANHNSIRIEPADQRRWANDPNFKNVNPANGRHYATLGAGPEHSVGALVNHGGRLKADFNRDNDRDLGNKISVVKLDLHGQKENEVVEHLIGAQNAFKQNANLSYELFPSATSPGYNSNGYAAGLAGAVGLDVPKAPDSPGLEKPVPEQYFQTPEDK